MLNYLKVKIIFYNLAKIIAKIWEITSNPADLKNKQARPSGFKHQWTTEIITEKSFIGGE